MVIPRKERNCHIFCNSTKFVLTSNPTDTHILTKEILTFCRFCFSLNLFFVLNFLDQLNSRFILFSYLTFVKINATDFLIFLIWIYWIFAFFTSQSGNKVACKYYLSLKMLNISYIFSYEFYFFYLVFPSIWHKSFAFSFVSSESIFIYRLTG